jgi:LAGLIDADG DNA endonuclease family
MTEQDTVRALYETEGLTVRKIAARYGIAESSMQERMKKWGIQRRNPGHRRVTTPLAAAQQEILDGELLGDGSILIPRACRNPKFQWGGAARSHGEFLHEALGDLACFFGPDRQYWKLCSKASVSLMPTFQRWRPHGRLAVPADIRVTPTILRHFYIGDGELRQRPGRSPSIRLAVQGFDDCSVQHVITALRTIGFDPTLQPDGSGPVIYIRTCQARAFLQYLGPCPFPEYRYKWLDP